MRKALIIGHHGQDGRLMSGYLSSLGYEVRGWGREGCDVLPGTYGMSICDFEAVSMVMREWQPDEVYHFAAHHHSSEQTAEDEQALFEKCVDVNVMSLVHFLRASSEHSPATRIFYASSSRIFGAPQGGVASEDTDFEPVCVYGFTKLTALHACRYFRRCHGLHVSVGVLFNHESVHRPAHYFSKKVIQGALSIRQGLQKELRLGSLSAGADWGYTPDTVRKIHRMMQMPEGGDYVIATGKAHTAAKFVETAFSLVGLDWREHVRADAVAGCKARPLLRGDDTRFRKECDWDEKRSFQDMIRQLIIDAGGQEYLQ